MPKSTDNIAKLVSFGASAVIDTEGRSADNVAHLIGIAVENGATLTIRSAARLSIDDLVRLAELGGKSVTFDLT